MSVEGGLTLCTPDNTHQNVFRSGVVFWKNSLSGCFPLLRSRYDYFMVEEWFIALSGRQ